MAGPRRWNLKSLSFDLSCRPGRHKINNVGAPWARNCLGASNYWGSGGSVSYLGRKAEILSGLVGTEGENESVVRHY